jgi:hypothetical protein
VSYTGNKSLQTEITLGPGQSLSGCYNSERKSEEEKMPSVGTFPRDLDILANVMTFFLGSKVLFQVRLRITFFAVDFFQERYISYTYFHFYRKILEVH